MKNGKGGFTVEQMRQFAQNCRDEAAKHRAAGDIKRAEGFELAVECYEKDIDRLVNRGKKLGAVVASDPLVVEKMAVLRARKAAIGAAEKTPEAFIEAKKERGNGWPELD